MEELLEYLVQNIADCPQHVLEDAHFQLSKGHVVSPLLTLTPEGGLYEADWDEAHGLLLQKSPRNTQDERVEVRSGETGLLARIGERGEWQMIIFHGLSNGVMQWLLQSSPAGQRMCSSATLDETVAQLCNESAPFPASTPGAIPQTVDARLPPPEAVGPANTQPPTKTPQPRSSSSPSPSKGKWIALSIGLVLLVGLLVVAAWWIWPRKAMDAIDRVPIVTNAGIPDVHVVTPRQGASNQQLPRWESGPFINL